jgi:hypothetical protein
MPTATGNLTKMKFDREVPPGMAKVRFLIDLIDPNAHEQVPTDPTALAAATRLALWIDSVKQTQMAMERYPRRKLRNVCNKALIASIETRTASSTNQKRGQWPIVEGIREVKENRQTTLVVDLIVVAAQNHRKAAAVREVLAVRASDHPKILSNDYFDSTPIKMAISLARNSPRWPSNSANMAVAEAINLSQPMANNPEGHVDRRVPTIIVTTEAVPDRVTARKGDGAIRTGG